MDFVTDEEHHGPDEELQPARSETWRPRAEAFLRGRYGLTIVIMFAVLAFLVGRALLHERPAGAPRSTQAPTPNGSSVTLNATSGRTVADLPPRTGADPTRCPGLQCYTAAMVPAAVRAAVRAAFPTARFTAVETIRLVDRAQGNPLWYREVLVSAGTATLTLRVQAHAAGDTPDGGAKDDGAHSVTFLDETVQQWFLRVRAVDRSGMADVSDQLTTLVADPRLLAL